MQIEREIRPTEHNASVGASVESSAAVQHASTDHARQGVTGHNVRYVLAFSLAGVLILLAVAWFWVS